MSELWNLSNSLWRPAALLFAAATVLAAALGGEAGTSMLGEGFGWVALELSDPGQS
ncbi:hypothetical protein [Micromonospora sp. KLBMP9576]|uniref:hypothetical protein n=1 Tax=Micromonospora sp. KLBMP9576 TaxID=3424769 RepID=UPI003D90B3F8